MTNHALQNLSDKKHNKRQILPVANDLLALRSFLRESITALTADVIRNAMKEDWRKLAVLTLARLIIFNKRRGVIYAKGLAKGLDLPHSPCGKFILKMAA